jgi:thiamine kinase
MTTPAPTETERALLMRHAKGAAFTPLAGWRNRSFRAGAVIVRLPAPGEAHVDRAVEARNARAAAMLGLGPEVVDVDEANGLLVTRAVAGTAIGPEGAERLGRLLARLHGAREDFAGRLDPAEALRGYAERLGDAGSRAIGERACSLWAALDDGRRQVPCHNDLVVENVLDDGRAVHLVDWEYAGFNDPAWDLAYVVTEAGWDAATLTRLLRAYGADGALAARIDATRPMVFAVNGLWHRLMGHEDEARERLARFRALIDKPEPGRHHPASIAGERA